jgi:hypothetical protein
MFFSHNSKESGIVRTRGAPTPHKLYAICSRRLEMTPIDSSSRVLVGFHQTYQQAFAQVRGGIFH